MKNILVIALTLLTVLANAQAGTQKQIGFEAGWVNTTAAATMGGKLYTTEKNGSLVQTDLNTGMRKVLGKDAFTNNRFLFVSGTSLYMIDYTGTLYKINHTAGTKDKVGIQAALAGIFTFATIDGMLYGVDAKGNMLMVDLASGDVQSTNNANYNNVQYLYEANSKVYCVEKSGSLFEWPINGGTQHMIGKHGDFPATIAGAGTAEGLYLVNKSGILTYVNTTTGAFNKIGKPIFSLTKFIFEANGKVYTIESMGSLYEVSVK